MSAKRIFPPLCTALFSWNDPSCSTIIWSLFGWQLLALGQGSALRKGQGVVVGGFCLFLLDILWQGCSASKIGETWAHGHQGRQPCGRLCQCFRSGSHQVLWGEGQPGITLGSPVTLGLANSHLGWLMWQLRTASARLWDSISQAANLALWGLQKSKITTFLVIKKQIWESNWHANTFL